MSKDSQLQGQDHVVQQYADEELAEAQAELDSMSPEDLLNLQAYIKTLEDTSVLPEAGGSAVAKLYGTHGGSIMLTARALHPVGAVDMLMQGISHLVGKHPNMGWRPSDYPLSEQRGTPQPAQEQTAGGAQQQQQSRVSDASTIDVETIAVQFAGNGTRFLLVKGGPYKRYGVRAWPESLSDEITKHVETMPVAVEQAPPPFMRRAIIGKDSKGRMKVSSFA